MKPNYSIIAGCFIASAVLCIAAWQHAIPWGIPVGFVMGVVVPAFHLPSAVSSSSVTVTTSEPEKKE